MATLKTLLASYKRVNINPFDGTITLEVIFFREMGGFLSLGAFLCRIGPFVATKLLLFYAKAVFHYSSVSVKEKERRVYYY